MEVFETEELASDEEGSEEESDAEDSGSDREERRKARE